MRHGLRHHRHVLTAALSIAALVLASTGAPAADGPGAALPELGATIDRLLAAPDLSGTTVSLVVASLDTGEVLFARRPDAPMAPASNMKLVTAAAALSMLGPDHRYETVFATDAREVAPVLRGDVFVRGCGDPSIVSEQLWVIAERFRTMGIERIEGDIVLDASCFERQSTNDRDISQGDRAYHARTGALSANFNTVRVHVLPGDATGDPARVTVSPDVGFVVLENRAMTGAAGDGSRVEVRRRSTPLGRVAEGEGWPETKNTIRVTGRIPVGHGGVTVYRSIDDPGWNFAASLETFLRHAGVKLNGGLRPGAAPPDAREIFTHASKPLSLIVRDMGKYSNNFVAEQLLKTLSVVASGEPGTTAGGCAALRSYIASVHADTTGIRIVDGSGFSRDNRLTTSALVSVIRSATSDFASYAEFLASLSVSGTDGTLSDRMGYAGLAGVIRAKTGLLDGVTSISGVMETSSGARVAFSILTNGSSCEAWKVHDVEHEILLHVHDNL